MLAVIGLTVCTGCRRDGEDNIPNSKTKADHLLVQEVYYGGTYFSRTYKDKVYPQNYDEDKYIKICNPTSKTIYLDNYALATHFFNPTQRIELREEYNFIKTHFGVSAMVLFGGNGTQHPLLPGASVLIARKAIDHKAEKLKELEDDGESPEDYQRLDQLLDLSEADFQWTSKDEASSKAKEMQLCYAQGEWEKEKMGSGFDISSKCVIALIKLDETPENIKKAFLEQAASTKAAKAEQPRYYMNISYKTGGHHNNESHLLILPYKWVEDAVTICPNTEFKWALVDPKIDNGHKGVQEASNEKVEKFAGKALTRRFDGNKFVDDNNSTSDFEVAMASMYTKANKEKKEVKASL